MQGSSGAMESAHSFAIGLNSFNPIALGLDGGMGMGEAGLTLAFAFLTVVPGGGSGRTSVTIGKRMFWSGGEKAMNAAAAFAKANGAVTMEMTRAGGNMIGLTRNLSRSVRGLGQTHQK